MRVLGVRVDCVDMEAAVARIAALIEAGGPCRLVATVNPEFVMHARRDPEFAQILESAELAVIDGSGVLWAGWEAGGAWGAAAAAAAGGGPPPGCAGCTSSGCSG